MRGPALNGMNIIGLVLNLSARESSHRPGSNVSASGPHRFGLRCIKSGMSIIEVLPGMYSGSPQVSTDDEGWCTSVDRFGACSCVIGAAGDEGRARGAGSFTGAVSDSRVLIGTGGKSRSVSLRTARTEEIRRWINISP